MIVATIASLKSRLPLLEQTVGSLLPQVDALCVYLNGHESVPKFLRHPKVLYAILSTEAGWRGAEAKLWFWDADAFKASPAPWAPDTVGLTCDDDILYPPDYAERMVRALDERPGSVACVHGSILRQPIVGWRESRRCCHFSRALSRDTRIHVPGTGTLAFRARDLPISLARDVRWSHADDIAAGTFFHRRGTPVWAVARPASWLRPRIPRGFSISSERIGARVDAVETATLQDAAPWPELEVPPEFEGRQGARVRRTRRAAPARPPRPRPRPTPPAPPVRKPASPALRFSVLVTGWNCAGLVRSCWNSILGQQPDDYSWEAAIYDDGSDDGTWSEIQALPDDPRLTRIRGERNMGAAFARWQLIQRVTDPERVVVLVDLDDVLEPLALARVCREYRQHPDCWVTYGSWHADRPMGQRQQRAQRRPYPPSVLADRSYRSHSFLATALRTFRRHLADGVREEHHFDPDGQWVMCATDVALMWALLEQCPAHRVRHIPDTIYRYRWRRPLGTVRRFGAAYKRRVRNHLASMPMLPLKEAP